MTSISDDALLDRVQRETLRYFWDFGHPVSGMARERSNAVPGYGYMDTVTTGGTGFGIMAMIAGAERGFLTRADVRARVTKIVAFLESAERFHGVFPHFLHGGTGKTIPFSPKDDGGDLVETSFLVAGLLCARQYFADNVRLVAAIDHLWHGVEWDWHTRGEDVLYWHWSERHDWAMNHAIRGWNECLITYVLAAASPTHAIDSRVYHRGWADSPVFRNGRDYHGATLPLGPDRGGPLFFAHYSFLGLDPRGLSDAYADYWAQNCAHVHINRAHCIANPNGFAGYGANCWGLTACDGDKGYNAFAPDNDHGVIAPTAAIASMPYAPKESMAALRHFHDGMGDRLFGDLGFIDSFNQSAGWIADSHLAIDQGPIVVMIENYRSALLWRLFMSCPEVAVGLRRLGFERRAQTA
ncbi:MAG: glucoamylase family protein [Pseudolabrys sp.]